MGRLSGEAISGVSAIIALIMGVVLAGCHVDQKAEVRIYREVLDQPPAKRPADGHALTLLGAMRLANQHNESLNLQGEAYLQAIIQRRRAAAAFLPTVDLAPSWTLQQKGSVANARASTLDVPVAGQMNLFDGFQDVHQYWADSYAIAKEHSLLLDARQSLQLDVAGVYFQVMRSEATVEVLKNSLAVQESRLRDTKGRFNAGIARALDVAQTEAQVASTRVTLVTAMNDVHNGRVMLDYLTGAQVSDLPLADGLDLPASTPTLAECLSTAEDRRLDLQAGLAAILGARHDVEVAFGQYYPSVSLNLNAYIYRESAPDDRKFSGLLTANIPIFAAGKIEADVRQAWSNWRRALLLESQLQRQIVQQVSTQFQNLSATEQRLRELQVELAAADQAFGQAEQSYQAGLATNLDRITAQDALLSAQLQATSAAFDRKLAYLQLLRSMGVMEDESAKMLAESAEPATTQPQSLSSQSIELREIPDMLYRPGSATQTVVP